MLVWRGAGMVWGAAVLGVRTVLWAAVWAIDYASAREFWSVSPTPDVYPRSPNSIRTSVYDKYSGSMKMATHLDHVGRCKTASGMNLSNRWTYQVFIINTRRDYIPFSFARTKRCKHLSSNLIFALERIRQI